MREKNSEEVNEQNQNTPKYILNVVFSLSTRRNGNNEPFPIVMIVILPAFRNLFVLKRVELSRKNRVKFGEEPRASLSAISKIGE